MRFPDNTIQLAFWIFGISLIIFHLPTILIKFLGKSGQSADHPLWKKGWECTDYFWFGVTLFTLVGVAYEADRIYAGFELRSWLPYTGFVGAIYHAESFLRSSQVLQEAEAIAWFNDGLKAVKSGDPLLQEAKELFGEGKPTYKEGKEALQKLEAARKYYQEFLNKHLDEHTESFSQGYDARLLRESVADRDKYAERLAKAYSRTLKEDPTERTLLLIIPPLLAVGFATRFAKVSARVIVGLVVLGVVNFL